MIDIKRALELAKEYYARNNEVVLQGFEADDCFIFNGGKIGKVKYGNGTIQINKENGEITLLQLPSTEGFNKIESAKPIDLKQYMNEQEKK